MNKHLFSKANLIKNTSIVTLCRAGGVVCGIVLDALILAFFGLSRETDAFFAALALPLLISGMFEMQVPKVMVPVFTSSLKEEGQEGTYFLLRNTITICAILLIFVAILGMGLSGILIPSLVPGLQSEVARLAVHLSLILFWLISFRGIRSLLVSVSYVYHQYFVPSSMKLISSGVAILFLVAFHDKLGIFSVAYGFILGDIIGVVIMVYAVSFKGFKYRFVCKFNHPETNRIFKLLLYPFLEHGLSQGRVLVENFLASYLGGGSLSAIRYASRIVKALSGVLLSSINITILPLVSHYTVDNNLDKMKQGLLKGLRMLFFIAFPLCTFLIFVNKPLLVLLFERGEVTRADLTLVGIIISLMSPYILLSRFNSMIQLPFYANNEMRSPFLGTVLSLLVYVAVMLTLFWSIRIYSFPIATCISSLFSSIFMLILFQKKFGPLGLKRMNNFVLRLSGATLASVFGFKIGMNITNYITNEKMVGKLTDFIIPTILGGSIFLMISCLMQIVDLKDLLRCVRRDTNTS